MERTQRPLKYERKGNFAQDFEWSRTSGTYRDGVFGFIVVWWHERGDSTLK
jgi:hypothetical protein